MSFSAPRGTRDILPKEIRLWQKVERVFAEVCKKYQFEEIRIPTFESTELFMRGVGDTTDIVQKEMFTFLDKSQRSMTLRPEGTAGVVRSFIQNGMHSEAYPVCLYYNLNNFRYERVAKGRYREFHQLGVEALGSPSPTMDVEVIALLYDFFKALGVKSTKLRINSIGNAQSRKNYDEALKNFLRPKLDNLCSDCKQRFEKNPLRILDCKVPTCQAELQGVPVIMDYLGEECRLHHEAVCEGLKNLGIPFEVDTGIVRGLDYYTKTVFEFVSENVGTQGTICGGGRYDTLVKSLGGPDTAAVGFALGVERLLMELEAQGLATQEEVRPDVFIAVLDEKSKQYAQKLAYDLRHQGIVAQTELTGRGLKAQMKYADKKNYRYTMVLGENELNSQSAELKSMQNKDERHQINLNDIEGFVAKLKA